MRGGCRPFNEPEGPSPDGPELRAGIFEPLPARVNTGLSGLSRQRGLNWANAASHPPLHRNPRPPRHQLITSDADDLGVTVEALQRIQQLDIGFIILLQGDVLGAHELGHHIG